MKNYGLTDEELRNFDLNGYVGPFKVYDREEIEAERYGLRMSLMDRERAAYDEQKAGNISNYDRHLDIPFLDRHIRRPQIVDRVRSILGLDLLCWRTEFFFKYPGDEGTDWHQSRNLALGSGIAPLAPKQTCPRYPEVFLTLSAWTALTDSTRANGCLQVMPGSHRELHYDDQRPMAWRPDAVNSVVKNGIKRGLFGYDSREIQVDPAWVPNENRAVNLELNAGEFVLMWEATMHGSLPNTTKNITRMALAARYVPTHVRIYPNMTVLKEYGGTADLSRWRAVLVSGEDQYQHNKLST
ncbi:MAG: chlorinating enzyme [Steroidobacteraceae bacterium]